MADCCCCCCCCFLASCLHEPASPSFPGVRCLFLRGPMAPTPFVAFHCVGLLARMPSSCFPPDFLRCNADTVFTPAHARGEPCHSFARTHHHAIIRTITHTITHTHTKQRLGLASLLAHASPGELRLERGRCIMRRAEEETEPQPQQPRAQRTVPQLTTAEDALVKPVCSRLPPS